MQRRFTLFLAGILSVATCLSAGAGVRTWSGAASANWSASANWTPAGAPVAGDDLVFPSGSRATMTNDLPAGLAVGVMTFGQPVTLSGNALTLMASPVFNSGSIVCNVDLKIGASLTIGTASDTDTFNGAIDVNGQTLSFDAWTNITGPINGSGTINVLHDYELYVHSSGNFSGTLHGAMDLIGSMPGVNMNFGRLSGKATIGTASIPVSGYTTIEGAVSPGDWNVNFNDVGTLHTKSLSLDGFCIVDLVPGGTSDLVQVTGTVTLGGGYLDVRIPSGTPVPGQTFTIIDNDGNDPVSGTFSGLPEGATLAVGTNTLSISYHGGDGNDVVLTAVSSTKSWTGTNSGLWSDGGNWSPAGVPVAGQALYFPSGSRATMTNDLTAGFAVGVMTFGQAVTLSGNALTLMASPVFNSGSIVCNVDLKIGASLTIGPTSSDNTFNGAIDVNGQTLSFDTPTNITGPINGSGTINVLHDYEIYVQSSGNFSGTLHGAMDLIGSMPGVNMNFGRISGNATIGTATIPVSGYTTIEGAVSPGDFHTSSPVIGTVHTKSLSLDGFCIIDLVPGGTSDLVQVTGTVTLGGGPLLVTIPSGTPVPGQTFTIIDNDGTDPVSGTFSGLPEGATLSVGTNTLSISYHGGDGNDVVLTTVSSTKSWTGTNSGLWSDGGNWSPAGVPVAGQALYFPAGSRATMTNDLAAGFAVGVMTFGQTVTLSGNALTLMASPVFTSGGIVCNADLKIGASLTIGPTSSDNTFNGAVDVNGQTLSFDTPTNITGPINGSGTINVLHDYEIYVQSSGNFSGTLHGAMDLIGSMPGVNMNFGRISGNATIGTATIPVSGYTTIEGAVSPGDFHTSSPVIGTVHTKSLSLDGYCLVDLVPGGTSDLIQVTGTVTLGGGMLLVTIPSGIPVPGQTFTIIDNDGNDPVSGTFAGLLEGAITSVGPYPFRISYHGGDGNDVVLTAITATTATVIQSAPSTIFGEQVTFTATVSSEYGPATGSVTFFDGSAVIGTASLQSGVATLVTSALGAGTHSISVSYAGNAGFAPSSSAPLSHQVQRGSATVSLNASKLSSTYGDNLTFTASVSPVSPSTATPPGSVSFAADGTSLSTVTLSGGAASYSTATLAAGTHAMTAVYGGDANYNGATSPAVAITVAKAPTTLDVHAEHDPSGAGDEVVLDIVVSTTNPLLTLSGTVTVRENSQTIAQQAYSGISMKMTVNGLSSGPHHLTVAFNGGDNFEPSSQQLTLTVLQPSIRMDDASITEGDSGTRVVSVPVHLAARSSETITVKYQSHDETAKAGEDYLGVDGTLTFAPGETGKFIEVTVIGDTTFEADERFGITLSEPVNATLQGGPATVTIVNDDASYRKSTFGFATIGNTQLMLDVDTPLAGNGPFPAIVWVGGSTSYAPGGDSPALRETARGYVVVIPSYRAAGQAPFPAQLDDLQTAIRWIRANAATLHVDAGHIGIWGGGAGAHLASLAGTTADRATPASLAEGNAAMSNRVQAVVDWAGPADLGLLQSDQAAGASCVPSYGDAASQPSILIGCALQSCTDAANAASPESFVSADDAPILIMHGANDCVVPPEQSQRFYDALKAAHVDATLRIIDGLGAFGSSWDASVPWPVVDAFLDARLKGISSKRRAAGR